MSVFNHQSLLTIQLETGYDLSAVGALLKIYFRKPDGTVGSWNATATGTGNTKMKYDVAVDDIDQYGIWKFQASYELAGREARGEIAQQNFLSRLEDLT